MSPVGPGPGAPAAPQEAGSCLIDELADSLVVLAFLGSLWVGTFKGVLCVAMKLKVWSRHGRVCCTSVYSVHMET